MDIAEAVEHGRRVRLQLNLIFRKKDDDRNDETEQ